MYTLQTGAIFVHKKDGENVAIGVVRVVDGTKEVGSINKVFQSSESITYLAELEMLLDVIKDFRKSDRIRSGDTIDIQTSTPVLAKHLNGDATPQKINAIKIHNQLEAWQEESDFSLKAEWIKSDTNPAQLLARQLKEEYIDRV